MSVRTAYNPPMITNRDVLSILVPSDLDHLEVRGSFAIITLSIDWPSPWTCEMVSTTVVALHDVPLGFRVWRGVA